MNIVKTDSLHDLANIIGYDIEENKKRLCFRESLIISQFENSSQTVPKPAGGICIDVRTALNNKFLIYVTSKFNVGSSTGGSKITTWVDPFFYTIEEKRIEFISGEYSEKQSLYIAAEEDGIIVTHTLNEVERIKRKYSRDATNCLITEGANFVVMRLLAVTAFEGLFEMSTFYINGDLCRNIYQCTGSFSTLVNNVKTEAIKINRMIVEECGIKHFQTTFLSLDGHIIKQEWNNCDYIIQLNPLQDPQAFALSGEACGCENVLCLAANWQDDLELMSHYLDRLKLCEYKAKDYLDDTPEISDLLADYVKSLLENKPEKVLDFTFDYFMRYGG